MMENEKNALRYFELSVKKEETYLEKNGLIMNEDEKEVIKLRIKYYKLAVLALENYIWSEERKPQDITDVWPDTIFCQNCKNYEPKDDSIDLKNDETLYALKELRQKKKIGIDDEPENLGLRKNAAGVYIPKDPEREVRSCKNLV